MKIKNIFLGITTLLLLFVAAGNFTFAEEEEDFDWCKCVLFDDDESEAELENQCISEGGNLEWVAANTEGCERVGRGGRSDFLDCIACGKGSVEEKLPTQLSSSDGDMELTPESTTQTPDDDAAAYLEREAELEAADVVKNSSKPTLPTTLIPSTENENIEYSDLATKFRNGKFELYDIGTYIQYLIETLIYFAGGIAVLFIVIGGYKYMIGGVSDDKEAGKKTIMYALMGLVVTALAWSVVNALQIFVTKGNEAAEEWVCGDEWYCADEVPQSPASE